MVQFLSAKPRVSHTQNRCLRFKNFQAVSSPKNQAESIRKEDEAFGIPKDHHGNDEDCRLDRELPINGCLRAAVHGCSHSSLNNHLGSYL